jgi:hypothetical protein
MSRISPFVIFLFYLRKVRLKPWLRRLITRLVVIVPAVFTVVLAGDKGVDFLLVLSQVNGRGMFRETEGAENENGPSAKRAFWIGNYRGVKIHSDDPS